MRDFVLGAYLWKRVGEASATGATGGGSGSGGLKTPLLKTATGTTTGVIGQQEEDGEGMISPEHAASTLRSAVTLGLVCDLVDLASVAVCWVEGSPISGLGEVCIGGGAAMFAAIAGQYLWVSRRG